MIVYGCFSHIQKMLGRTETRTRDRMYCQAIRTVTDISRDDRARIATCRFANTDILKKNYSIDEGVKVSNYQKKRCYMTLERPPTFILFM